MTSRRPNDEVVIAPKNTRKAAGDSMAHDSARGHVRGSAVYVDDIPEPKAMLHLAPGYARDHAAGTVTHMDLSAVRAAPGVVAVLTASDIPFVNDCSPALGDDAILSDGDITFHGQVLFVVAAETRKQALNAATLAQIEVDAAAPTISARAGFEQGSLLMPDYTFKRKSDSTGTANAAHQQQGSLTMGGQEHFYLEGQVSMAVPFGDDEMQLYVSSQHPAEIQHIIAQMLGWTNARVMVDCRRMGGAFGGKESQAAQWAALAALVAYKTGRPAKMRLDRDDDMRLTGKRHDFECDWSVSHNDAGVISNVEVDLISRCGASADLSMGINDRAMFHADNAYFYPDVRITTHKVWTNTVSNTAFRGFGGPQGMLFAERMMNDIAFRVGRDPLDVRYDNLYRDGADITPYGMPVTDFTLPDIMQQLEASADYRARVAEIEAFNAKSAFTKKGIALTPVKFGVSFTLKHLNQGAALIHVYADGSVHLSHGGTEMGQGLYTKISQIVASVFGVDARAVRASATRTDKVPNASPTAASSGTDLNGKAAENAALTIRARMARLAASMFNCDNETIIFDGGMVKSGDSEIAFTELAGQAVLNRISLSSTGFYATPKLVWEREKAWGRPFLYFACGAACSEVEIDILTGEMRVTRVDILHDVGNSVNPAIDIGQIEGGFVQGMGWLTTEELVFSDDGKLMTHAPSTYKIPTAYDVPEDFNVALYSSKGNLEDTVHRSRAVGEPPLMLANSVYCAVHHALASLCPGQSPDLSAPTTPEAILDAITKIQAAK